MQYINDISCMQQICTDFSSTDMSDTLKQDTDCDWYRVTDLSGTIALGTTIVMLATAHWYCVVENTTALTLGL